MVDEDGRSQMEMLLELNKKFDCRKTNKSLSSSISPIPHLDRTFGSIENN